MTTKMPVTFYPAFYYELNEAATYSDKNLTSAMISMGYKIMTKYLVFWILLFFASGFGWLLVVVAAAAAVVVVGVLLPAVEIHSSTYR